MSENSGKPIKPIFESGVINGPLPGQLVDEHLKKFGHLPNTPLCDEKGSCVNTPSQAEKEG